MYLFRLHIRPQGGTADMKTTFDYCIRNQILGVGWRLDQPINTEDMQIYLAAAEKCGQETQLVKYIHRYVRPGDLVWTRSDSGQYYLAKVKSGWRYQTIEQPEDQEIDLGNIFDVDMVAVQQGYVPGKVVACFRPSRTMQEIADPKALAYSKYLWNTLKNCDDYSVDLNEFDDPFMLLDDSETEDLLFIYLQTKGWYVIPHSRKADTMSYEFSLVHSRTGEPALIQVKTGNTVLNRDDDVYAKLSEKLFLFQSNEFYVGLDYPHIECITRDTLLTFIRDYYHLLPGAILNKAKLAGVL